MRRQPLRAGIVGLGFIGRAHVDALRRIPGVRVDAVAGASERILADAEALDIPKAHTDYRQLLADPDIDVVHNCTPNHLHFAINGDIVQAGKACFSEKPLAINSAEAVELVQAARVANVRTAVNFNHRGFPQVQQARAMISDGQIGGIYAVHGSYLQDWLLYDTDWNWRADPRLGGPSRAVADIGSHWMDLAQSVTGSRITEVMADLHTAVPVRYRPSANEPTFGHGGANGSRAPERLDTEDFASVLIRFANGAHGSFTVSQVSAGRKNRLLLQVDGARAALEWNSEDSERLWCGTRDKPAMLGQRDPGQSLVPGLSTLPAGHAEGWNDALRATIASFYHRVREGQSPDPSLATWEDGWRAVALTEAIVASHRSRQWIAVPESAVSAPNCRRRSTR